MPHNTKAASLSDEDRNSSRPAANARSTFFDPSTPTPAGRTLTRNSSSTGQHKKASGAPSAGKSAEGSEGSRPGSKRSHEADSGTSSGRTDASTECNPFPVGTCLGCPEVSDTLNANLSSYLHVWHGNLQAVTHCVVMVLTFDAIEVCLKMISMKDV